MLAASKIVLLFETCSKKSFIALGADIPTVREYPTAWTGSQGRPAASKSQKSKLSPNRACTYFSRSRLMSKSALYPNSRNEFVSRCDCQRLASISISEGRGLPLAAESTNRQQTV